MGDCAKLFFLVVVIAAHGVGTPIPMHPPEAPIERWKAEGFGRLRGAVSTDLGLRLVGGGRGDELPQREGPLSGDSGPFVGEGSCLSKDELLLPRAAKAPQASQEEVTRRAILGCWFVLQQGNGSQSSETPMDCISTGINGHGSGSAAPIDYMQLARDYVMGPREAAGAVGLHITGEVSSGGPDYVRAAEAYRQAAAEGNPLALYNLGVLHIEGLGVEHDAAEGASLLSAAADGNVTAAQYLLATLHFKGEGVAKDQREAFVLFSQAAASGHVDALEALAECYYQGIGVPRNIAMAMHFFDEFHRRRQETEGSGAFTEPIELDLRTGKERDIGKARERKGLESRYSDPERAEYRRRHSRKGSMDRHAHAAHHGEDPTSTNWGRQMREAAAGGEEEGDSIGREEGTAATFTDENFSFRTSSADTSSDDLCGES